ncbi:MAG: nicotinate-nucleotide--dimethylbenzimidazole phosphoribosyltransferase [Peptostreptococcaceae bacterium]|nr:nicotinate-nucleotide--dimethylbenzimidazole phosphoribosyltransferase [Peptostreptococcaceae bacterium]
MYLSDRLIEDAAFVAENEKLLRTVVGRIEPGSEEYRSLAEARQNILVKPPGSLGKLEAISIKLAAIYREKFYKTDPKVVLAFGADHGIYEEGISTQPQAVTALAFANYAKGICSIGVLSKLMGSKVIPVDVGIDTDEKIEGVRSEKIRKGTSNFAKGPAMSREEAILSLAIGIRIANEYIDAGDRVIGLGEMGICNTSPSSAIVSILTGEPVEKVTGLGAGTTPDGLSHKVEVIKRGIECNRPDPEDALDILAKVGGFEIGALAGVILACADRQIPVVLDGFISYAAALLAQKFCAASVDYMLASHKSAEPASAIALEKLGLEASLDMDMRLGEGSGAAIFFSIIDAANEVYTKVATFEDSGVPIEGCEV